MANAGVPKDGAEMQTAPSRPSSPFETPAMTRYGLMRRRIGDVYRINLSDGKCAFMQHLANDTSQLNSSVVLVIPIKYPANEKFKVEQITAQDRFFAHVFLKAGETLKVWEYVQWTKPAILEIPVIWTICNL